MIHNKYYHVIRQYLGDYTAQVYGRSLVGKVPISQKGIALAMWELEKQGILASHKEGQIKRYWLNVKNEKVRDTIAQAEIQRKIEFLSKHRKLAHLFRNDTRIVGIFGSYAQGTQKNDSDIDVFIVGKRTKDEYDAKGRAFDLEVSIKYFSEKEFKALLMSKNNLLQEIVRKHVILFGVERFIDTVWREYYGFD